MLLFVSWRKNMQSLSGHYLMCHQVPMVFLLLSVYLGAVAYISVEISLGSCWRRDILRVKGQGLITNCNFLMNMQSSRDNYSMRHRVSMVFKLLFIILSAAAYISGGTTFGRLLVQEYLEGRNCKKKEKKKKKKEKKRKEKKKKFTK